MGRVLIIGAGGVGNVTTRKCAMMPEVFDYICLASRRIEKCDEIAAACPRPIATAQVDADNVAETKELIDRVKPDVVINVALPYQDLPIMDACLEAGVHYLDTANYEPKDEAKFDYHWQWAYQDRFKERGLMAVLGCGFDPGVTSAFCTHALKEHFDSIDTIDIVDCNGGDHGKAFATNFNPETNIREITQNGRYYEDGEWIEIEPMSVSKMFDFPGVGERRMYLLFHEELQSLAKFIPGVRRLRFWMTFGEEYITHLRVLQNVGMTSIKPIEYEGKEIVPLQFLKAVLPDPGSLAENYTGKTCIGCVIEGKKSGETKKLFIYNICDHAECYREVGSQAVSYTAGVPPALGANLMVRGIWKGAGVFNIEQLDPTPFMELLGQHGLPWTETFL